MPPIPPILHYIWIGGRPLPDRFRANIETWRRHNPDFQIREWNEGNLDWSCRYMRAAYAFRYWSRVTNLARLQILRKQGGIYLDVDIEMLHPLRPLLDNACFLGFQDPGANANWVNGAVFGAVPDHWFVNHCIARLLGRFTGVEQMDSRHGPGNITQALIENGLSGYHEGGTMVRDVRLYPRAAFYPFHWTEAFEPSVVTAETFLVHHWARSWVPDLHENTDAEAGGFLRKLAGFVHRRVQWRLDGLLGLEVHYNGAIASAASAWFRVRRARQRRTPAL